MTRLIDADALKEVFKEKGSEAVCGVELCKAIISQIDNQPTVEAIPVEWIKEKISNNKGFYNSSLRRLLDEWAERKERFDCNDCYYSMQNCNDRSICCEDETALCDNFEPVLEREEE